MERDRKAGHAPAQAGNSLHNFTGSTQAAPPPLNLTAKSPDDQQTKGTVIDGGTITAEGSWTPLADRIPTALRALHETMFVRYPEIMADRLTAFMAHATFPDDKGGHESVQNALWNHAVGTLQRQSESLFFKLIPAGPWKEVLQYSYAGLKAVWNPLLDKGGQPKPFKALKEFYEEKGAMWDQMRQSAMDKHLDFERSVDSFYHALNHYNVPKEALEQIIIGITQTANDWEANMNRATDMEDAFYMFANEFLNSHADGTFKGGGPFDKNKPVAHLAYCNSFPQTLLNMRLGQKVMGGRRRYALFMSEASIIHEGFSPVSPEQLDGAWYDMCSEDQQRIQSLVDGEVDPDDSLARVYTSSARSLGKGLLGGTDKGADFNRLNIQRRLSLDMYSYATGGVVQDFNAAGAPMGGALYGAGGGFSNAYQRFFFRVLFNSRKFPEVPGSNLYQR